ncbi:sulfide/dihydroorotate dehydrogenase-like FAD/NAD-binding protein [Candidatus Thorarchaeota archaeon]|jgi:ferredoxin--NADP+ reductase|nr:MAG: sulfide/dihydroorotate dehydrogenase-like FAD/NAD-binding protein [Candidatus Thorarchaeota archaeon]
MPYEIKFKQVLNPTTKMMVVRAPDVAAVCRPGQFVILRVNETGERFPLTIADFDRDKGDITIVYQEVGKSTKLLGSLEIGDEILDFVGPLGKPSPTDKYYGTVVAIGGGCGSAICYPVARAFKESGNYLITINGARSMDLLLFRKQMYEISDEFYETTDDGSCGVHGFVTAVLGDLIQKGRKIDLVFAVGPVPMMKFVSKTTEPSDIKTLVSLNSIMVDGTGMCGACRVTVGGQMKFACVDGPEFDGHQVDFNELMGRLNAYWEEEAVSMGRWMKETGGTA